MGVRGGLVICIEYIRYGKLLKKLNDLTKGLLSDLWQRTFDMLVW